MHQVDRDEGATKTGKLKRVMMPMTMMLKKLAMMMVEGFRVMMMSNGDDGADNKTRYSFCSSIPYSLLLYYVLLLFPFLFLVGLRCWRWDGIGMGVGSAGMGLVFGSNWCSDVFYFFKFKMGEKSSLGLETGFWGIFGACVCVGVTKRKKGLI